MPDWIEAGKEILKLAVRPRYAFTLWFGTLLILAVPLPDFLRLTGIRNDQGHWLGIICLFTFVLWIVELILFFGHEANVHYQEWHRKRQALEHLDSLNAQEAQLLIVAVSKGVQTILCGRDNYEVDSLVAKGLVERVPSENGGWGGKPVTVKRFVWEKINQPVVLEKLKARVTEKKPT